MIQTVGDTVLELTLKLTCWQKPAGLDFHIQVLLWLIMPDHWFWMWHQTIVVVFWGFFGHTNMSMHWYVLHHFINYAVTVSWEFFDISFFIVMRCILTQCHIGYVKLILNWYFWNQLNIKDEIVFFQIIWIFTFVINNK